LIQKTDRLEGEKRRCMQAQHGGTHLGYIARLHLKKKKTPMTHPKVSGPEHGSSGKAPAL
jgi:hypothetical protein